MRGTGAGCLVQQEGELDWRGLVLEIRRGEVVPIIGPSLWVQNPAAHVSELVQIPAAEQVRRTADPNAAISLADDGTLTRWDLAQGVPNRRGPAVIAAALGDKYARVATANAAGLVEVSLAFDQTGRRLASAAGDGTMRAWDAPTGGCVAKLVPRPDLRPATFITWAPGPLPQLLSGSEPGDLQTWDLFVPAPTDLETVLRAWKTSPRS